MGSMVHPTMWITPLILIFASAVTATASPQNSSITKFSTQIVGGAPVMLGDVPWQISLYKNSAHICGGSILNEDWVITAAHCVYNAVATDFQVKAGLISLSNPGTTQQVKNVLRISYHKLFNPNLGQFGGNDIAVLLLVSSLTFNQYVGSIRLPPTGYVPGDVATVSGWGATREGGPVSDALNSVVLPVLSFNACYEYFGDDMTDMLLCAGLAEGQKDACQGDSGGPMACAGGAALLCGLVSGGEGCAREGFPGVYTNVAFYLGWIAEQIAR